MTAPIQANILPPTFQASCPPPQGSDTSAPGKHRQMALTVLRLILPLRAASSRLLAQVDRRPSHHHDEAARGSLFEAAQQALPKSKNPQPMRAPLRCRPQFWPPQTGNFRAHPKQERCRRLDHHRARRRRGRDGSAGSPRLANADMLMRLRLALAMTVPGAFDLGRNDDDPSMPDAALGDDALGKALDLHRLALEHGDLHRGVVIKGNAHGRDREIVVFLVGVGQSLRKVPRLLIVDVDHARHARARSVDLMLGLQNAGTHQVAHGFRAILIAARLRQLVDFVRQLVIDGDGDPLHQNLNVENSRRYAVYRWTSYWAAIACSAERIMFRVSGG